MLQLRVPNSFGGRGERSKSRTATPAVELNPKPIQLRKTPKVLKRHPILMHSKSEAPAVSGLASPSMPRPFLGAGRYKALGFWLLPTLVAAEGILKI